MLLLKVESGIVWDSLLLSVGIFGREGMTKFSRVPGNRKRGICAKAVAEFMEFGQAIMEEKAGHGDRGYTFMAENHHQGSLKLILMVLFVKERSSGSSNKK